MPFLDIAVFVLLTTSVTAAIDAMSQTPIVAMNQSTYLFGGPLGTSGLSINSTEWNSTSYWANVTELINDLNTNGTGVDTSDPSYSDNYLKTVLTNWYQANLAPALTWVVSSMQVVIKTGTACLAIGHYLLIYMPFLPASLVWTLDGIMWITYALGLAQLISNRTLRPT